MILIGEFVALLSTDTLPVTLPAAAGANAMFSETDCPGVTVVPVLTPLALNPVPETVMLAIVTVEVPLFVSVALNELLLPRFTFPKLKVVGFAPSSKVGATPVPLNGMVIGEPGALLTSEIEPVTLPADVGANTALNVAVLPGAIVTGRTRPVMLKPVPETLT